MVARRPAIFLGALLLVALLVGVAVATGTPEPVLTVDNDDTVSYQITAYTVENQDEAGYLNFEVTTDDGERKRVTYADLVWPGGYHDITLVDDGVNSKTFDVGPGETVTEPVDGWTRGDVTLYIIESEDDDTPTWSRTVTCGDRGQEHGLSFDEDSGNRASTVCASSLGWVFR